MGSAPDSTLGDDLILFRCISCYDLVRLKQEKPRIMANYGELCRLSGAGRGAISISFDFDLVTVFSRFTAAHMSVFDCSNLS